MPDTDQKAREIIESIRETLERQHFPYVPSLDGMRALWDVDGYIETCCAESPLGDALRECDCPRHRGMQRDHDATCYMLTDRASYDAMVAFIAQVTERVAVHLAFCHTCGNEITNDGAGGWQCLCWCFLASALQNYLGRDFDGAAQEAADLWKDAAGDWPRVWSGDYATEHNGVTYYPAPGMPGEVTTF